MRVCVCVFCECVCLEMAVLEQADPCKLNAGVINVCGYRNAFAHPDTEGGRLVI